MGQANNKHKHQIVSPVCIAIVVCTLFCFASCLAADIKKNDTKNTVTLKNSKDGLDVTSTTKWFEVKRPKLYDKFNLTKNSVLPDFDLHYFPWINAMNKSLEFPHLTTWMIEKKKTWPGLDFAFHEYQIKHNATSTLNNLDFKMVQWMKEDLELPISLFKTKPLLAGKDLKKLTTDSNLAAGQSNILGNLDLLALKKLSFGSGHHGLPSFYSLKSPLLNNDVMENGIINFNNWMLHQNKTMLDFKNWVKNQDEKWVNLDNELKGWLAKYTIKDKFSGNKDENKLFLFDKWLNDIRKKNATNIFDKTKVDVENKDGKLKDKLYSDFKNFLIKNKKTWEGFDLDFDTWELFHKKNFSWDLVNEWNMTNKKTSPIEFHKRKLASILSDSLGGDAVFKNIGGVTLENAERIRFLFGNKTLFPDGVFATYSFPIISDKTVPDLFNMFPDGFFDTHSVFKVDEKLLEKIKEISSISRSDMIELNPLGLKHLNEDSDDKWVYLPHQLFDSTIIPKDFFKKFSDGTHVLDVQNFFKYLNSALKEIFGDKNLTFVPPEVFNQTSHLLPINFDNILVDMKSAKELVGGLGSSIDEMTNSIFNKKLGLEEKGSSLRKLAAKLEEHSGHIRKLASELDSKVDEDLDKEIKEMELATKLLQESGYEYDQADKETSSASSSPVNPAKILSGGFDDVHELSLDLLDSKHILHLKNQLTAIQEENEKKIQELKSKLDSYISTSSLQLHLKDLKKFVEHITDLPSVEKIQANFEVLKEKFFLVTSISAEQVLTKVDEVADPELKDTITEKVHEVIEKTQNQLEDFLNKLKSLDHKLVPYQIQIRVTIPLFLKKMNKEIKIILRDANIDLN